MPPRDLAPDRPGRDELNRLLSELNQEADPERRAALEATLRSTFECELSILVLDMCGFTRLSREHGIIHYLAMIHQMDQAARPAVQGNNGLVIKQEADNLFAVFDEPARALEAALDIFRAFDAVNSVVPSERDLIASIGIGHGPTLLIGLVDLFGTEVNIASKLGEDLAGPREILLSPAAHAALPPDRYAFEPRTCHIGAVDIVCQRFTDCLFPRLKPA